MRQYLKRKENRRLISWQTRTLAQYIAVTVEYDSSKGPNPVLEAAGQISLDSLETKELEFLKVKSKKEEEKREKEKKENLDHLPSFEGLQMFFARGLGPR